jgi:phosphotransferase system enzyme I (PtsI)
MKIDAPSTNRPERVLNGLAVSPGIAVGTAWCSESGALPVPEYDLAQSALVAERQRFADAVAFAVKQLKKLKSKATALPESAAEELGYLLDARLQMLSGSRLVRGVDRRILEARINAEAAVQAEIEAITEGFEKMGDAYLAARADDIREVGDRLLRNLMKQPYQAFQDLPQGAVVIAEELTPADTVLFDPTRVAAFATELGGAESHTAIVARSLGIPAVLGVPGLTAGIETGDFVIVDGGAGRIVVNPVPSTAKLYARRGADMLTERGRLAGLSKLPAVTRDDVEVALLANLELVRDIPTALDNGAVGVGLLRTEFMFMNRESAPTEEEQYQHLRSIVVGMGGRPVTIRTLDIGGDKLAPSVRAQVEELESESPNPALGIRGIRLSLSNRRLFETQLAAILRASADGPVRILLPMIASIDEVKAVREIVVNLARRLKRRRVAIGDPLPKIGVMIEVPGAALAADALSTEADFFSIGTNDLTMYTLAIDRGDERVAKLYNPLHPAVLRLIQFTVEAGLRARIPVAVCGEIAGDPRFTALLLGLGVRELSMSAPSLPRVKERVRNMNLLEASRRARTIMDQWDGAKISALLDDFNASM